MRQKTQISLVVTSIFHPNKSLLALAEGAKKNNWEFIIIGDVSSPSDFQLSGADYYDLARQKKLGWKFADLCPQRHYTRKNIGYLLAMSNGSSVIVETDDDNIPKAEFWGPRDQSVKGKTLSGSGWINICRLFSKANVWPRGFPLEELQTSTSRIAFGDLTQLNSPIQQGLADENPDVDAIYRMTQSLPLVFDRGHNYLLQPGVWCPFNSQNTTWFSEVFQLMYLPSFCTFRMTDIWRSFVAQRILWECDGSLMFHNATVWQERNEHNLLKDFEQEVPGYINNHRIKNVLEKLSLKKGKNEIGSNLLICYEELIRHKIITDARELELLDAWLGDIKTVTADARKDR
jgi:hypothetical protein